MDDVAETTGEHPHRAPAVKPDATGVRLTWIRRGIDLGWSFTPTRGKKPYKGQWPSAPRSSWENTEPWARYENAALRTGKVSGVVVLDDDTDEQIAHELFSLPSTVTVITGSGKRHYYFTAPEQDLKNSSSKLAPHVDFKGERGAAVYVGSVHPDTGGVYQWAEGRSPDEVEVALLPEPLLERLLALQATEESGIRPGGARVRLRHHKYAATALGNLFDEVSQAAEGCRNDGLNSAAFRMGRFVGAGMIDREEVEGALSAAAKQAGLPVHEIAATLRSGLDAGSEDPFDASRLEKGGQTADWTGHGDGDDGGRSGPSDSSDEGEFKRPIILLEGGDLPKVVDQAEAALIASGGQGIFQRESMLLRIVKSRSTSIRLWGRSPAGAISTLEVDPLLLVERFMNAAVWMRVDGRSGELREIDCPQRIAKHYLARVGNWNVPPLLGVIEAPTLRPDGSVLDQTGYDSKTGLYLYPTGVEFPPVPLEPSKDDAARALGRLDEIIQGFPFVKPTDRAAALAAILTGIVRRSLRTAPLIAFRAPKMGSGKSLLADVVAMVGTGRPAPVMTQGKGEEEDRKRMLALLIEGEPIACIDNVDRPLGGAALCSVLTQETWKDRLLGKSAMVAAPTSTTWLATGNNLVFYGDITTRAIVSDLDAACEHPEQRRFDVNLYEHVPRHRAQLVVDGLTVLRAFQVAGLPDQGLPVFGRFEQWSDWVRSPLVWLGHDDPCRGRERLEDADPVRLQLRGFLSAWHARYGEDKKSLSEAMRDAQSASGLGGKALWESMLDAAGERGTPNPRRLGAWLLKHDRRPEGGLRIEKAGERSRVALWRVRSV